MHYCSDSSQALAPNGCKMDIMRKTHTLLPAQNTGRKQRQRVGACC